MRNWVADRLENLANRIRPPKPKLVWKFGCKHGLPNFVHCPECDN
jgi:hypothetical protein